MPDETVYLTSFVVFSLFRPRRIAHNFEEKYYEDNRVDAVAMERLTGSPYIIKMYGFCGLTVVQEFAGRELPQVVDAGRMNSTEKLKLAKQIAMGVAAIHSIKGDDNDYDNSNGRPTLVHNDINPANLLFTSDNRPVLNDFNIAIMLMKHNVTGETCPFYSHFPNPQWKAPEEQVVEDDEESNKHPPIVNEKIDIYALGNVFYRVAVGVAPWKRPEADKLYADDKAVVAQLKKYNGTFPSIPVEILRNATKLVDPALAALLDAMRLCYHFNPTDRPTAAELVTFLDRAIAKIAAKG
jgi:serine/threonine protein kinase